MYALKDSFHIDHGELDGMTPQQCFVLGVEWSGVYQHIISDSDDPLYLTIHHANKARLQVLCDKYKRFHDYVQCSEPDDTYGTLFVGGKKP